MWTSNGRRPLIPEAPPAYARHPAPDSTSTQKPQPAPAAQSKSSPNILKVKIAHIHTGERLRALNPERVDELKKSIATIGLKTPISLRQRPSSELGKWGGWQLVSGLHRLEACRALGFEEIEAREETGTETDARLWEIAENLHRAELTALERSEHIAEWIRLTEEKQMVISAQIAPKLNPANPKGAGRHEGGVNAAARELGIERTEAQRAIRRAENIAPDVARSIRAMPAIADSGVELDALARVEPQQQIAAVEAVKAGVAKNVREALATKRPATAEASVSCIDQALEAIKAISAGQPATVEAAVSCIDQALEAVKAISAVQPATAEAAALSHDEAIDIAPALERFTTAMLSHDEAIDIAPALKRLAMPYLAELATVVLKHGVPELVSLVRRGKITLTVATLVTLLPPQEQRRCIADANQTLARTPGGAGRAQP